MVKPSQLRRLATSPTDFLRFRASGQLPRLVRPGGPLVELLRQVSPRDRAAIVGVSINPSLGYQGAREFANAAQAYRWLCPQEEMLDSDPWPAESWRDKRFTGPLYLDDVLANAASYPPDLAQHYPRLRRPGPPPLETEADVGEIPPERP
ncbi:MAG: hypothetical protein K0Q43_84 [Ramlibacter sp.]|jgi:hypothetical protein|nr:hypothetical protein [Ramlibacter sp.]